MSEETKSKDSVGIFGIVVIVVCVLITIVIAITAMFAEVRDYKQKTKASYTLWCKTYGNPYELTLEEFIVACKAKKIKDYQSKMEAKDGNSPATKIQSTKRCDTKADRDIHSSRDTQASK